MAIVWSCVWRYTRYCLRIYAEMGHIGVIAAITFLGLWPVLSRDIRPKPHRTDFNEQE